MALWTQGADFLLGVFNSLAGDERLTPNSGGIKLAEHYLRQKYGMGIHKEFIQLWSNNTTLKKGLINLGFTTNETMVILYSLLAKENLAWLFQFAGFQVSEQRVSEGLSECAINVNLTYAPSVPYAFEVVNFNASTSSGLYRTIANFTWDFGDDNVTTTTFPVITHIFTTPGDHNVTLTVTDEFGFKNSTSTIVTVLEDNIPPITTNDYEGLWHNSDFTITLTTTDRESGVAETYYQINSGPVKAVSVDGQPFITTEGANDTLEYWSVDKAGNEELPHRILTGIKLDKTKPLVVEVRRQPEGDVEPDQKVKVLVNATDLLSGIKNVTLSYSLNITSAWIDLPMTFNSTTGLYEAAIQVQQANVLVKYKVTAYDNAGNIKVEDNNGIYYDYTVIPEFPSSIILPLFMILCMLAVIFAKKSLIEA
jgi:PKD repeat protein